MATGIEILNSSGRGVIIDGDDAFALPIARGWMTKNTSRVLNSSDPTYMYTHCEMSLAVPGYDPATMEIGYSCALDPYNDLGTDMAYWNLSHSHIFTFTFDGNSIDLAYRCPASGNVSYYDYYPEGVTFRIGYEIYAK